MIISWLSTFNYGNIKKSRLIQSFRKIQSIPILNRQSKSHSTKFTVNLILIIIHHYRKSTSSSLFSFSTIVCPKWCWRMAKPSFPQNLAVSPEDFSAKGTFHFLQVPPPIILVPESHGMIVFFIIITHICSIRFWFDQVATILSIVVRISCYQLVHLWPFPSSSPSWSVAIFSDISFLDFL